VLRRRASAKATTGEHVDEERSGERDDDADDEKRRATTPLPSCTRRVVVSNRTMSLAVDDDADGGCVHACECVSMREGEHVDEERSGERDDDEESSGESG